MSLIVLLITLAVADTAITWYVLKHYPQAREANPVLRKLMEIAGPEAWPVTKLALSGLAIILLADSPQLLLAAIILYAAVLVMNVRVWNRLRK